MELTLSELQEMASRQQQQIEAQQQMLVAKVGLVSLGLCQLVLLGGGGGPVPNKIQVSCFRCGFTFVEWSSW